jgi:hypothetical protein
VEGWIKAYRRLLENGWLKNHNVFIFWMYCLFKAAYEPTKAIVGFREVNLEPGQFIFGRRKAAKETGLSEREIRTCLAFLSKAQNVTHQTTHHFSIISIVNWNSYQNPKNENDPPNDPQATHGRPHIRMKRKKTPPAPLGANDAFEAFYQGYPKHEGGDKARRAWGKLDPLPELVETIMQALDRQKKYKDYLHGKGQWCAEWPLPATWLNGRRWEDEVPEVKSSW